MATLPWTLAMASVSAQAQADGANHSDLSDGDGRSVLPELNPCVVLARNEITGSFDEVTSSTISIGAV